MILPVLRKIGYDTLDGGSPVVEAHPAVFDVQPPWLHAGITSILARFTKYLRKSPGKLEEKQAFGNVFPVSPTVALLPGCFLQLWSVLYIDQDIYWL